MSNEIKEKIEKEYQRIRSENINNLQKNIDEILNKHPKLLEIENELTAENAKRALQILSDGKARSDTDKMKELSNQKKTYMKNNNISLDYDKVSFNCKTCEDTGIRKDSKSEKCSCYKDVAMQILYDNCNFKMIEKLQFENFSSDYYSQSINKNKYDISVSPKEQIEGVRKVANRYIKEFEISTTKNLMFIGRPGTGKTFMSGCIANELIKEGHFVLYYSSPDFFDKLSNYRLMSNTFSPDPVRYDRAKIDYNNILTCDLLIIDDFGTETDNPNRQPDILSILNHRIGTNKKVLISTNMDIKNLSTIYDERLLSRISGYFSVIKFAGDDIRHKIRNI